MSDKLTYEEIDNIRYFWKEKGDPTRWVGWDEAYAKCPELWYAYNNWKAAEKLMDSTIERLHKGSDASDSDD